MFTRLIIDGVLKIAQIVRYSKNESVARVFDPRGTVPQAILKELKDKAGVYRDEVNGKDYKLTPTGLVPMFTS